MYRKRLMTILSLVTLTCVVVSSRTRQAVRVIQAAVSVEITADARPHQTTSRQGAWVDSVVFTEQDSAEAAVSQLIADELDIYAYAVSDPVLYQTAQESQELAYSISAGNYNEIFFNPAVFTDTTRLNPFSNANIREAVNWLIDRNYIIREIHGGLGLPKFFPIKTSFPDYIRYADTCHDLEAYYAYNLDQATSVITAEMLGMGATLVDSQWYYGGSPVTLIGIIRVEDERLQIGDYVADQFESLGFVVDRQYKTSAEASPIWLRGNPYAGEFHFYTGGWVSTAISRDEGSNFNFFYTPRGLPFPIWQTYAPTPEFDEIALKLDSHDFQDMQERGQLFAEALERSLNDPGAGSLHAWVVHEQAFWPRGADTTVASDLAGGIAGARAWPYTVRFTCQEGGVMRIAEPDILNEPWNPIAGTNWLYDWMAIRATQDYDTISDPDTGLTWPQRIERAEVVIKDGLPVTRTHEWVDLTFAPEITVPGDAWVDWDATNQRFITTNEKYTQTITANVRSTVYYPADLFATVKWHDGSPLDPADFVIKMIMTFDPGKPESPIYSEDLAPAVEAFLAHFKGVRIVSTDPLIIETHDDQYQLDAELNVASWWPTHSSGPAAWHNMAVGVRADAAQALAFSKAKADQLGIEWMSFISGSSLGILEGYMDQSTTENFIPYAPTMGQYVTSNEATARWANLQTWYDSRSHFWLGTGPFYLGQASPAEGTLTLLRFPDFPDPATKWNFFVQNPSLTLNYTDGAPGSYLTANGVNFPANSTAHISVNEHELGTVTTGASGEFTVILNTLGADEGYYMVKATANPVAITWFSLNADKPVRPPEGTGTFVIIMVPPGIAYTSLVYLPMLMR